MTIRTSSKTQRMISAAAASAFTLIAFGLSASDASAGYRLHPEAYHGGFRHGGFGGFRHGGGFGGFGAFGGAGLALGILGAMAANAEVAQAAQPQCWVENQPVLLSNGTYYYRRIRVCQ